MDQAIDLAKLYPTTRLPTRPGPSVVETISISEICKFALFNDAVSYTHLRAHET